MNIFVLDQNRKSTVLSTGFEVFETLSLPKNTGDFYSCIFKNGFNEINRIGMLWKVLHLWLSGARFVLNCYCHWSLLDLQNGNGAASYLHIREGVTKGEPLAMFAYSMGILLLIKQLKPYFSDVTQPWYT